MTIETKNLEALNTRETVLEAIKLAGSTVGKGVQDFLTDREKLFNTAVM